MLNHRLRRIERRTSPDREGFAACAVCKNGAQRRLVIRMEGTVAPEPERSPLCPACGRDVGFIVNITSAMSGQAPQSGESGQ